MSFYGKVYAYQGHENFDAWLKSVGVPDDKIPVIVAEKSTQKIEKNGDSYVFEQTGPNVDKAITFTSGVEFDDTIGPEKSPIKSTISIDGNTVIHVVTSPIGTATFTKVYDGDNLVVTITSDKFSGVAKRFYKAE